MPHSWGIVVCGYVICIWACWDEIKETMKELWKDIKDYEDYQVSTLGRVKRSDHLIKPQRHRLGYVYVYLNKQNTRKKHYIHRLVASAFIANTESKPEVNHIDANKENNTVTNLEWCTKKENMHHRKLMGLYSTQAKGSDHPVSKLTESDVQKIKRLYAVGVPVSMLSIGFQVCESQLHKIIKGKSWKHLQKGQAPLGA